MASRYSAVLHQGLLDPCASILEAPYTLLRSRRLTAASMARCAAGSREFPTITRIMAADAKADEATVGTGW
jgi:hypothetical protein